MAYQSCHQEGTHRNEDAIKKQIVDCCRRGTCGPNGEDIPLEHRRPGGKGSHYIANQRVGLMSTPDEIIARMRRAGILPKKERKSRGK